MISQNPQAPFEARRSMKIPPSLTLRGACGAAGEGVGVANGQLILF